MRFVALHVPLILGVKVLHSYIPTFIDKLASYVVISCTARLFGVCVCVCLCVCVCVYMCVCMHVYMCV